MIKHLQKYGNSPALVIDKALMEATGISPETPIQVTIQGDTLTIRAANIGLGRERVDQVMDQVGRSYGKALKRLSQ